MIAPEEIVDPNVDEHSVMTYLSQFPKSKLKPGAPLRAKTLHPKRAKAYGPGEQKPTAPESIQNLIRLNRLLLDPVKTSCGGFLGDIMAYLSTLRWQLILVELKRNSSLKNIQKRQMKGRRTVQYMSKKCPEKSQRKAKGREKKCPKKGRLKVRKMAEKCPRERRKKSLSKTKSERP